MGVSCGSTCVRARDGQAHAGSCTAQPLQLHRAEAASQCSVPWAVAQRAPQRLPGQRTAQRRLALAPSPAPTLGSEERCARRRVRVPAGVAQRAPGALHGWSCEDLCRVGRPAGAARGQQEVAALPRRQAGALMVGGWCGGRRWQASSWLATCIDLWRWRLLSLSVASYRAAGPAATQPARPLRRTAKPHFLRAT